MFPIIMGQVDAFELAADLTLAAIETALHVIGHDKTLGGAIERGQLDGLGRAILDAQTAAGAGNRRERSTCRDSFPQGGCAPADTTG